MDYYLIPNTLADDGSYIARVVAGKSYTERDLIDLILSERNVVSRPDLEAVMTALKEAMVKVVQAGGILNLSWLKFDYSIKGYFPEVDARLKPDDHRLEINAKAGSLLMDAIAAIKLRRIRTPDFGSRIIRFIDYESKTSNQGLTPGGIFEIVGERLRIGGDQPDKIGLYLRDQDLRKIKVTTLLNNDPSYLSGQLPVDLPPGVYKVVLCTQIGTSGNRFLKEIRTSVSNFDLRVG